MDIETMKEFLTYVQSQNLNHAARKLHCSPSSLSRHMVSFEHTLGIELFSSKNPISLTEAGNIVSRSAEEIIRDYERLLIQIGHLKDTTSRVIAIVYLSEDRILSDIISIAKARFEREFPEIRVRLLRPHDCTAFEMVENREADIALIYPPFGLDCSLYARDLIMKDKLVVATNKALGFHDDYDFKIEDCRNLTYPYPTTRIFADYHDYILDLFSGHGIDLNIVYVAAETSDEFYLHDDNRRIWTFTKSSFLSGKGILPQTAFLNSNLHEIEDEEVEANRYAIYRKDNSIEGLSVFVRYLEESGSRYSRKYFNNDIHQLIRGTLP